MEHNMKIDPNTKEGMKIMAHQQLDQILSAMEADPNGVPLDKVHLSVKRETTAVDDHGFILTGIALTVKVTYDKPHALPIDPVRITDDSGKTYELSISNADGVSHLLRTVAGLEGIDLADLLRRLGINKTIRLTDISIATLSRYTNLLFEPVVLEGQGA